MEELAFHQFPFQSFDKIRYSDTDRQGHVNNATFATYLETGRVEFLYHPQWPVISDQASFVIVGLDISFTKEILWPGQVEIGSGVLSIGKSSVKIFQKLFQNEETVALAKSTIVQVDDHTGRAKPLSEEARQHLNRWLLAAV